MGVNGRLAFKATVKAVINDDGRLLFNSAKGAAGKLFDKVKAAGKHIGKTSENGEGDDDVEQEHDMYLYWDGRRRWVISPHKGDPAPYGMNKEEVKGFIWAEDSSITPDKITRPWKVWTEVE